MAPQIGGQVSWAHKQTINGSLPGHAQTGIQSNCIAYACTQVVPASYHMSMPAHVWCLQAKCCRGLRAVSSISMPAQVWCLQAKCCRRLRAVSSTLAGACTKCWNLSMQIEEETPVSMVFPSTLLLTKFNALEDIFFGRSCANLTVAWTSPQWQSAPYANHWHAHYRVSVQEDSQPDWIREQFDWGASR